MLIKITNLNNTEASLIKKLHIVKLISPYHPQEGEEDDFDVYITEKNFELLKDVHGDIPCEKGLL